MRTFSKIQRELNHGLLLPICSNEPLFVKNQNFVFEVDNQVLGCALNELDNSIELFAERHDVVEVQLAPNQEFICLLLVEHEKEAPNSQEH
jgi:hypothetical protein